METKPEQIVRQLLENPELYREKAREESEVWGKIFSNKKQIEVRKADQEAAAELKMARRNLPLVRCIREHGFEPQKGLSLACGSGRAERGIMQKGMCTSFHGIDVAEGALNEARKLAAQEKLNITYEEGDLNDLQLQRGQYDLVVTQNCLHHVVQLESLAREIYRSMTPTGVLWINDYVGETQFQYTDKRLEVINAVLAILPEKVRTNHVSGRTLQEVKRPVPGTLASPFEAIRSAEIMPVFLKYFDVVEEHKYGAILRLVMPLGARQAYLENEDTRSLFELLRYLDQLLVEEGVIDPSGIQCLLRPKPELPEPA